MAEAAIPPAPKVGIPPVLPSPEKAPEVKFTDKGLGNKESSQPKIDLKNEGPIGFVKGLPPLPEESSPPSSIPETYYPHSEPNEMLNKTINDATGKALVFAGLAFVAFCAGITLAVIILTGAFDAQILWIKGIFN